MHVSTRALVEPVVFLSSHVGMKTPIPPEPTLRSLYDNHSDKEIALTYSVSESTVRRWRRRYKIESKPRGPRTNSPRPRKVSDEAFAEAVKNSLNVTDTLRSLGMSITGSGHKAAKERIRELELDTTHFGGRRRILGTAGYRKPLSYFMVNGKRNNSASFKKRLLEEGILTNQCEECGQLPWWNGKPLVLQLDHIDGDVYNNLRENLRILCPHCHTQTRTFAGRNINADVSEQA